MFGMGMGEILLIAVVALLVLGPDRLPSAAKAIGKGIRDLRAQTRDLQQTIEKDTHLGDAVRELRGALRGDPETLYERATGQRLSDIGKTPKGPSTPVLADGSPAVGSGTSDSNTDGSSAASDIAGQATDHAVAADPLASAIVDASVDRSWTPPPEAGPLDPDQPVIRTAPGAVARSSGTDDDDANHG